MLTVLFSLMHPSRIDPADSAAVFVEYAESHAWLTVHLGQLIGTLLVLFGLGLFFARLLAERRLPVLAWSGAVAAAITAVLITVLQAVDGVSLKRMADLYAEGGADPRSAAFFAAEAVRWVEIGINSVYRLFLGSTMLLAGLAIARSGIHPRWFGWLGVALALVAWVARGLAVWYTGFAHLGVVAQPAPLAGAWLIALGILMWRSGGGAAAPSASV